MFTNRGVFLRIIDLDRKPHSTRAGAVGLTVALLAVAAGVLVAVTSPGSDRAYARVAVGVLLVAGGAIAARAAALQRRRGPARAPRLLPSNDARRGAIPDTFGIDRVVRRFYESMSGAEPDRRWHQFRALFHEGARIGDGSRGRPRRRDADSVERFVSAARRHPDSIHYEETSRCVHVLDELAIVVSGFAAHGSASWSGVSWLHLRRDPAGWRIESVVSRPRRAPSLRIVRSSSHSRVPGAGRAALELVEWWPRAHAGGAAGHGGNLAIRLPMATESSQHADPRRTTSRVPAGRPVVIVKGVMARNRHALVLEPDSALRRVLVEVLGDLGFAVIASEERTQVLHLLSRGPDFDLAVIDLVEGAAGMEEFVSTVVALSEATSMPLILMTDGEPPPVSAGNAVCLAKPFDLEELLGAVRASIVPGGARSSASRIARDELP